jgi:O-antigen/teichoic acid export membrane protein
MFIRLLLMAKLLPVTEFAELSAALVVSSVFNTLACVGVFVDLQRRLPVLMARGQNRAAAMNLARAALLAVALSAIFLVGAVVAPPYRLVLALGVIQGLSQQLFLIATTESRSAGNPLRYAMQQLTRSVLTVPVDIAAALAFSTAGPVLIADSLAGYLVAALIFLAISRRTHVPVSLASRLAIRSLPKVKWLSMLFLLAYSTFAAMSVQIDRWISTIVLTRTGLATYSFAWIVMIFASSLQAIVNASAYPMIARRLAQRGQASAYRLTLGLSVSFIGVSALIFWPGLKLSDLAIDRFFPNYAAAKPIVPILTLAAACTLSDFWTSFLVITGHERSLLGTSLSAFAIAFGTWYFLFGGHIDLSNLAYLALGVSTITYLFTAGRAYLVRH